MSERVSLRDIACATGVAVSTVSMALRDDTRIKPATRIKVREASRRLGYYPNPLLAALASRHFRGDRESATPIAYIYLPEEIATSVRVTDGHIRAQQEQARKLGYRLEPFALNEFRDGDHATNVLFSRGYLGIVLQTHFRLSMLPGMDWSRFSVVGWGQGAEEPPDRPPSLLYRVAIDHFRAVQRVWHEAWKRGYRRIGFALFTLAENSMEDQLRWGAILSCLQRLPPSQRVPSFLTDPAGGSDFRGVADWVRDNRVDAVIGFNGFFSWALRQAGIRLPEDIGFASLHVEPEIVPPNGVLDSGTKEMRVQAMMAALELLDQQIRHHQYGLPREPRTLMINSEWIEGTTLPHRESCASSNSRPRQPRGSSSK